MWNRRDREEQIMKKLAIIGIVFAGLMVPATIAQAKPVGMSKAEYQALMIRSEGLNQKYGVGQSSQQALIREKLQEIGAWAVPSTSVQTRVASKPVGMSKAAYRALMLRSAGLNQKYGVGQSSQQALIREKLQEIGAWAVPSTSTQSGVVSKPLVSEKLAGLGLPAPTTTAVVSSSDGFDWNDAGIGAAFVLGAMLLGAASLVTIRRQHRPVAH